MRDLSTVSFSRWTKQTVDFQENIKIFFPSYSCSKADIKDQRNYINTSRNK